MLAKEKLEIMFGLKNRGKTIIFVSRHSDETVAILISHFLLHIGALENL